MLNMQRKRIGLVMIAAGVLLALVLLYFRYKMNQIVNISIEALGGECILQDGTCIHEEGRMLATSVLGFALSGLVIFIGAYFVLFARKERKVSGKGEDRFRIILSALNEDEQKVMRAVKEQDGIKQSTLRIRTDLSKTKLSVVLKELEKKNLVKKVVKGKTNLVFLKRKI